MYYEQTEALEICCCGSFLSGSGSRIRRAASTAAGGRTRAWTPPPQRWFVPCRIHSEPCRECIFDFYSAPAGCRNPSAPTASAGCRSTTASGLCGSRPGCDCTSAGTGSCCPSGTAAPAPPSLQTGTSTAPSSSSGTASKAGRTSRRSPPLTGGSVQIDGNFLLKYCISSGNGVAFSDRSANLQ